MFLWLIVKFLLPKGGRFYSRINSSASISVIVDTPEKSIVEKKVNLVQMLD